jgi:thiamine-phosphate pyrophosphorylase
LSPSPRRLSSLNLHKLYAIVDVDACARVNRVPLDVGRAFLSAGARLIQIRAKTWGSGAFLELAVTLAEDARAAGATLIVNDRVDVAAIAQLGVHVGQEDLPAADARALVGDQLVGLSTHTDAQLQSGIGEPVSYLAIGPVFGTATKDTGYEAIGLETVRRASGIVSGAGLPLVAIGGIRLEQAPQVIAAGASSVAVISDLLDGDPEERARAFLRALD